MNHKPDLAILGGQPHFTAAVNVGQLYFPEWSRYETAMRGIFERRYYNNNGPLHTEFERKLASFFGVKHAICVHNATFGLMMLAQAMQLKGKVIVPAFTFVASLQSLSWQNLEPVFCDVDPETHQLDVTKVAQLIDTDVCAVLAVNLWGGACDSKALQQLCNSKKIKLFFDSAHAFGCEIDGNKIGQFGDGEVFSFHATKMLSATEGGCITTNSDEIAARLISMRPSYGTSVSGDIRGVINARMSEAQAAIGLLSLEDFERNRQKNEDIYHVYRSHLESVPGIRLVKPSLVSRSNFQYSVIEVDSTAFGLSRDQLQQALIAENINARRYFYPGAHRTIEFAKFYNQQGNPLPITDKLCDRCLQLPIGAMVNLDDAAAIALLIRDIQLHAAEVLGKVS